MRNILPTWVSTWLSTCILLLISFSQVSAQLHSIVLGRPTDTSMTADIMFVQTTMFYIKYGTQAGVYTDSTSIFTDSAGEPIIVAMSRLVADTKYYYVVAYKIPTATTYTISPQYTFHTQRLAGSTFTFTIEADEHLYDYGNAHLYQIALNNVAQDNPDFMFTLGDIFGDDHYPFTITAQQVDSLRKLYRSRLGAVCSSIPFHICLGNHDGEKMYYLDTLAPNNLAIWSTLSRKKYYANPEPNGFYTGNTHAEGFGMGLPEDYYAFTWGDALFVVLDAYRFDCDSVNALSAKPNGWNWTLGADQYNWLQSTLQNSHAKYKFAFIHHPLGETRGGINPAQLFEWGGHEQNNVYDFSTHRPGWAMPIHQLFVNYGVNILFQGHDHLFAHELLDSVTYQEVPMMADSTYIKGMVNAPYYTADTFENSGYVRVTVSPSCVKVEYVKNYLPQDTLIGINHSVAFSYTIGNCSTTNVAISQVKNNEANVYPNPTNNILNVSFSLAPLRHELTLFNAYGNIVGQTTATYLDTDNLPNGIYYLQIASESATLVKKVIVIH